MIRGIVFGLIVWFFVSVSILIEQHLSGDEKIAAVRAIIYGLITAVISAILVTVMVVLF